MLFHFAVPKLTTSWCFSIVNSFGGGREHEKGQTKSSRLPQFVELCVYVQGCSLPVRDPTKENWFLKWWIVSLLSESSQLQREADLTSCCCSLCLEYRERTAPVLPW